MRRAVEWTLVALLLATVSVAQKGAAADSSGGGSPAESSFTPAEVPGERPVEEQPARQRGRNEDNDESEAGFLTPGSDPDNRLTLSLAKHMIGDQRAFWSSPSELRRGAAWKTIAPFAGFTALAIAGDRWVSKQVPASASGFKRSKDISDYTTYSLLGSAGGAYLMGHLTHNDHLAETGFLAGEAALNSTLAVYAIKQAAARPRPLEAGSGQFLRGGASFPSEHSAIAWSVASVVAHEYPGPLTRAAAYGMASAVMLTRVTSKQHFPSDVVVGSALGWYFARQIYRARHDAELGGAPWGKLASNGDSAPGAPAAGEARAPGRMGSPNVPLDSWMYPALERLAAFGYVQTSFTGLKPWTRLECAQMTEEAGDALGRTENPNPEAVRLEASLREGLAHEFGLLDGGRNLGVTLESVYLREVSMSGPALTDSYHFGQTLAYDFGRPARRGENGQAGASFSATSGPLAVYVRAEFQHAPAAPPLSDAVRNFIAAADLVPAPPDAPFAPINRPRLLDTYVALNLKEGWQFSFGKQSLVWAPGPGGSFLWSDNAEPVPMARLLESGVQLPGILKWLGPARVDNFFGQLAGHTFVPHPYIYGSKINFKPFPGLELGFGRTVTIGGRGGNPLTVKNFFLSFFGQRNSALNSVPGDSHSSFDWTFHVPKAGNYLVFYGDLYADDDFLPFQNQPKNPYRPGIYLTHFPHLPKLDFHMEAANTESPGERGNAGNLNYWNYQYRDGYTNNGNLIGNTVGRMGRALQCWFTYWISPQHTLQFAYKHNSVSPDFVPQGGYWQDYSLRYEKYFRSGLYLRSQAQYEHISSYPLLFNGPQKNVTAIVELGLIPGRRK